VKVKDICEILDSAWTMIHIVKKMKRCIDIESTSDVQHPQLLKNRALITQIQTANMWQLSALRRFGQIVQLSSEWVFTGP
jgi:hypothetical protein